MKEDSLRTIKILLFMSFLIIIFLKLFCISTFILTLFEFVKNKDNWIKDIFDRYKELKIKKKIEFILMLTILWPFWISINVLDFIFIFIMGFRITLNLLKKERKEIKVKNKEWRIENMSVGGFEIKKLVMMIIEDFFINRYNRSFFYWYVLFSKNKKDYKEIISKIGFRLSSGISFRFLNSILIFCEKDIKLRINKIFYIKLLIFLRYFLIKILWCVNSDYRFICVIKNKIITENFKINVNGKNHLTLINEFKKDPSKNAKFGGFYFNKLYGDENRGHIFMEDDSGNKYGLTSSKTVNSYSNGKIKTSFIGIQSDKSNQYAFRIKKNLDYEKKWEERKILTPKLIKDFKFYNINILQGKEIYYSYFIKNTTFYEVMLRGSNQEIIKEEKERLLNDSKEKLEELSKIDHEELGDRYMSSLDLFEKNELKLRHKNFIKDWEEKN